MKNTKILSITLPALLLCLGVMHGCKKSFLDVDPQGQVKGQDFWKSSDDAARAVNAIYANLRSWENVAFAPIAVESLGSDDAEKGSSTSDATFFNEYDNFSVTSTQGQLNDFWKGQYKQINLTNQVIDNVDTMTTVDGTLKARYIGEAKFSRAFAYFRLVRAFGDVPLRLRLPVTTEDFAMPRTPKEQVWDAIEKDLTDAAAVLPVAYPAAEAGKFTKGAALGLHAKVALYRKKWADAKALADQVIALGIYDLMPDFQAMFRTNNENSKESLFEIQASLIPGNPGASNSQYSQVQGVRGAPRGGGWGFNVPTADLAAFFEAGDPRRDATIIFRGETTPQGDVIPPTGDNPMYNEKSYVPFSQHVDGYNEGSAQNIRMLRFSDILLIQAEAANEMGNSAVALQALERVRARARQGNAAILPKVTTTDQAALRTAIYRERRAEFAMEFDRYFDVIRQGRGAAVFGAKGWKAGKNEVWPIPQEQIDISSGVITQNPGY